MTWDSFGDRNYLSSLMSGPDPMSLYLRKKGSSWRWRNRSAKRKTWNCTIPTPTAKPMVMPPLIIKNPKRTKAGKKSRRLDKFSPQRRRQGVDHIQARTPSEGFAVGKCLSADLVVRHYSTMGTYPCLIHFTRLGWPSDSATRGITLFFRSSWT